MIEAVVPRNLVLAPLLAALVVAAPGGAHSAVDRSTTDRPDDISGPQIHAVYVVPADGTDRGLDTNGTIAASVDNWETWLRGQTGAAGCGSTPTTEPST
jgi:uncharacterized protein involved in high-affinity Fe2+ transport